MKIVRTLAGAAGLLAIGHISITLGERHEQLVDLLAEIADSVGRPPLPDVDDAPPAAAPVAGATAALLYGPGTSKLVEIHAAGGRTIHSSPAAKWAAVCRAAALVRDTDLDGPAEVARIEAQLLADHRNVREVRYLPPNKLNRATTRLLDRLTNVDVGGAR